MRRTRPAAALVAAVALLAAAGCGGKHTPVKVGGKVTLDGKPVEGATVTFYSAAGGDEGRPANGRTDADGVYHLGTMGDEDGALPGEYKVVVAKWGPLKPNLKVPNFPDTPEGRAQRDEFLYRAYGDGPREKNILPPRYGDLKTTPLTWTVSGRTSEADFELTK
jgi:hypothetical protein